MNNLERKDKGNSRIVLDKRRVIRLMALIFIFITGGVLKGCGNKHEQKKINFVYGNWSEGIAMVHVVQQVLEDKGYEVNIMRADEGPLFASLANKDADAFLEAWLPITHKNYMQKYQGDLEILTDIYDGARIGLVVPDYVTIDSVSELNQYADKFNGKIWGIEEGAGIMNKTREVIRERNLDFELMTSSESGMMATLKRKISRHDWVVITGWKPHYMFSRFDLKMLKGSQEIYGETEKIKAIAMKGFSKDAPYVAEFIKNIKFNDGQIGSLMHTFEEISKPDRAAKKWISQHDSLINSWLPKDKGGAVKHAG